jgi:protocatechuate 3,4-dioxygenase, beta subunit
MPSPTRRQFLTTTVLLPTFWTTAGAFAEALALTPRQTEGPFYPDRLPLDTDNDLIIVNDNITPALGEVTHLSGKLLGASGQPIRNALIEIWQVDGNGVYLHTRDHHAKRDANFQGFGRFLTGSTGEYYFRTIKPVPYPGRPAPHIHVKVKKGDRELLTTQIFIAGHSGNAIDGVYRSAGGLIERELTMAEWKPIEGSKIGEWAAHHEIILGRTPDERARRRERAEAR